MYKITKNHKDSKIVEFQKKNLENQYGGSTTGFGHYHMVSRIKCYFKNRNRVIGSVENCSSFSPSSCPSFLTMKQEFTDEESKRQYMKERQKKDNHNLSKLNHELWS